MENRSHRSTEGQLPKHLKDFYVNMSGSSTPIRGAGGPCENDSHDDGENTIVEQADQTQIISSLMERLKA